MGCAKWTGESKCVLLWHSNQGLLFEECVLCFFKTQVRDIDAAGAPAQQHPSPQLLHLLMETVMVVSLGWGQREVPSGAGLGLACGSGCVPVGS